MSTTADTASPKVLFVTLGCAKNEVDTDRMRALLVRDGFSEAEETSEADLAIVNTCSFLASATSESIECTLALAEEIADGVRACPIVMCGCVPSRYGDELPSEFPEVAAFVKTDEEDGIVEVARRVLGLDGLDAGTDSSEALRTVEGASAYIKISDGCDRRCSFCAIPDIRGPYASRSFDEIASEARSLLDGGVRELVLIGQDTGIWGLDLAPRSSLVELLRGLAPIAHEYGAWIRVLYLQPEGMDSELIATIRDTPEVLDYIDIPIQHCSGKVLSDMGRTGDAESLRELFARLRSEIPGMVLRTTAMAGFPGESDEEADELADFISEQAFDYCSVFAYSAEEGTPAAEMRDQIDEDTKLERTQTLIDIAEQLGFAATAAHVGETVDVLIDGIAEGPDGPELIGHAWFQAPDCDGVVHIEEGQAEVGQIVSCKLVDSFCYELIGAIV